MNTVGACLWVASPQPPLALGYCYVHSWLCFALRVHCAHLFDTKASPHTRTRRSNSAWHVSLSRELVMASWISRSEVDGGSGRDRPVEAEACLSALRCAAANSECRGVEWTRPLTALPVHAVSGLCESLLSRELAALDAGFGRSYRALRWRGISMRCRLCQASATNATRVGAARPRTDWRPRRWRPSETELRITTGDWTGEAVPSGGERPVGHRPSAEGLVQCWPLWWR